MTRAKILFPGWRYGPNGELELFQREEDVPQGWTRTPPGPAEPKADPFDHDGDGKPGGSLPKAKRAPARRKVNRRGDSA